ncbi:MULTISPECIES: hypothetical protein [unclassified Microcoleus]|jgi:hypothetical protein|uniref:hypothetical protein n=1 Tax=unclassified Microcoleus TaxID=2642155 RepID=UPI002FCFD2A4
MNTKQYDPHNYSYIQPNDNDTLEEIVLIGQLDTSDYVGSVPPSEEVCQNLEAWVGKNRERTRSKIANRLLTMFATSLVTTFVVVGVSSLMPNSDKGLLKDLIPLIITPQVGLLGVTIGFYFDKD